jgi:protein kinase A
LATAPFGKVWLVSYKPPIDVETATSAVQQVKETFALKVLSKHQLIKAQQHHSVIREREMLSLLQHPFILQLVSSYQDDAHLYLLLPLIHGGELFTLLHKQKSRGHGLDNAKAAFYSACVIEAIGHFHQRLIGTFFFYYTRGMHRAIRFPSHHKFFDFICKPIEI